MNLVPNDLSFAAGYIPLYSQPVIWYREDGHKALGMWACGIVNPSCPLRETKSYPLANNMPFMVIITSFPGGSAIKNLPPIQETQFRSLDQEDPLEKGMATHSSIPAWEIPWAEEPGGLQPMGSQRVRHDLATKNINTGNHCIHTKRLMNLNWILASYKPAQLSIHTALPRTAGSSSVVPMFVHLTLRDKGGEWNERKCLQALKHKVEISV